MEKRVIIVDKPKLRFLLAGRQIDVQTPRAYRKGRVYAVGVHRQRTLCHAVILNSSQTSDGWQLTIRQQAEDKPIYLAANPGGIRADYTTNPTRAARETDGSPLEAAAKPGSRWLRHVADQARERDDQTRREAAHSRRMGRQGRNLSVSRVK